MVDQRKSVLAHKRAVGDSAGLNYRRKAVKKSKRITDTVVATDHTEIYNHVKEFGGNVCMTKESHVSGTDRCYETD